MCDVFTNVFLESQDNLVDQEFSSRYELSPPPAEQDPSHFCHFVFSRSKILKTKKNLSVLTMPMDPWIEKSILETFLKNSNKTPPLTFLKEFIFDVGRVLNRTLR